MQQMTQKKKHLFNLRWSTLRTCALLLLLAPPILFLLGFVKPIYALPVSAAMVVAFILAARAAPEEETVSISCGGLLAVLIVSAVWCWLGGQGGLFYQTDDWNWRNAIFRDLIIRDWPVYLPTIDSELVYYVGYWLPAAVVGKVVYWVTGKAGLAWNVGNMALWAWTTICVVLVFLLLFGVVGARSRRRMILAVAVMIGFSGLDIIGCIIENWSLDDYLSALHLEWWVSGLQFSSNTTCLFWVFNQIVPTWIAFMLFLREKNASSYAFIVVCALISAPFPCIGLAVLMLGRAAADGIRAGKQRQGKQWLRQTFSAQNIIAACTFFPIVATYYLSNMAVGATASSAATTEVGPLHYLLFMALECGLYYALLLPENYKNPIYYLSALFLLVCPFIHIGSGYDFCMRASIPALLYLMTLVIRSLYAPCSANRLKRLTKPLLVACLLIGLATPCMEVFRGFYMCAQKQTFILPADSVISVDIYRVDGVPNMNFVSTTYEDTFFFRYLANR